MYIDKTIVITLGTKENIPRARAFIPLVVHVVGRPPDEKDPIPRKNIVSEDKILAEGSLVKIYLG